MMVIVTHTHTHTQEEVIMAKNVVHQLKERKSRHIDTETGSHECSSGHVYYNLGKHTHTKTLKKTQPLTSPHQKNKKINKNKKSPSLRLKYMTQYR